MSRARVDHARPKRATAPSAPKGRSHRGDVARKQSPELLEVVLQSGWEHDKRKRQASLAASVREQIEKQAERWESPIRVFPDQTRPIRQLLARGPRSIRDARFAGDGMSLLLLWWLSDDREFDLQLMLRPVSLAAFQDALTLEGYPRGTVNAYVSAVNRLGGTVNPNQVEEWRALDRTPTAKSYYSLPCGEDEVWALFELAWAQRTARVRDGLLGLLYLALGVGLYERALTRVHGADVRQSADGTVMVHLDHRWLSVRPRYAAGLLALADRAGPRRLVPGARGKNKTTPLLEDVVVSADTPAPKVPRLVANYRWWLDEQLGISELVDQCGANALVHLAQIHYRMPGHPSVRSASALTPAADLDDGPWAPDWPARHHRS